MKKNKILFFAFSLLWLVLTFFSPTNAKYIGNQAELLYQSSSSFFFSSELVNTNPYINLYGGGSHSYNLNIKNYLDSLRVTPDNIDYTISLSSSNLYTGYSALINSVDTTNGSLTGGTLSSDEISISFDDSYSNETIVTFTISSTAPFTKTITQTIKLFTVAGPQFEIIDQMNQQYLELRLTNTSPIDANTISILWDTTEFTIDNANNWIINSSKQIDVNNLITAISLPAIPQNSAIVIKFFKTITNNNYTTPVTDIVSSLINIEGLGE